MVLRKEWMNMESDIIKKLRKIMNEYDPALIIHTDYQIDEYDPEIVDILNRCSHIRDFERFKEGVLEVLSFWFALFGVEEILDNLAKELYNAIHEND
ncbi:hypothetical protein PL321_11435 [Caloramator sp. mosi_1]|uniref:hypothetical protein n=1 Tax=Caloramator sp. mosi_1 TaxID=3023090 RepID=UPI00235F50AD|nr:hypothetical protein [Caloramator sp. mosi_1]WDC83364.1 hypothetical protein PL321_11435 [Caloramator sp. mosi_1]